VQLSENECKIQALEAENQVLKQEIKEYMHRGEESLVKTGENETVLDKVQYCFCNCNLFSTQQEVPGKGLILYTVLFAEMLDEDYALKVLP